MRPEVDHTVYRSKIRPVGRSEFTGGGTVGEKQIADGGFGDTGGVVGEGGDYGLGDFAAVGRAEGGLGFDLGV